MGLLFWIMMLVWLVFGFVTVRPPEGQPWNYGLVGGNLFLFILLLLLGWHAFGAPVK